MLATAEKLPNANHWTVYDGKGGVFRAKRDQSSRLWHAYSIHDSRMFSGKTLQDLRKKIAAA